MVKIAVVTSIIQITFQRDLFILEKTCLVQQDK